MLSLCYICKYYCTGPDFDTPSNYVGFNALVRTYQQYTANSNTSAVIHCSAGIGRAGMLNTVIQNNTQRVM